MRNWIVSLLFQILFGKEGETMMAMLWTQQIIYGKKVYSQVPAKLRDQVAELLRDSGCDALIEE